MAGKRAAIFSDKTTARPDGFWSTAMNAAGSAFSVANGGSQPHNILGGGQIGFNYQLANLVFGVKVTSPTQV